MATNHGEEEASVQPGQCGDGAGAELDSPSTAQTQSQGHTDQDQSNGGSAPSDGTARATSPTTPDEAGVAAPTSRSQFEDEPLTGRGAVDCAVKPLRLNASGRESITGSAGSSTQYWADRRQDVDDETVLPKRAHQEARDATDEPGTIRDPAAYGSFSAMLRRGRGSECSFGGDVEPSPPGESPTTTAINRVNRRAP